MLPVSPAPRDHTELLDGFLAALTRLADLGVTVHYDDIPAPHQAGWWDGAGCLHLRRGASLPGMTGAAVAMWLWIVGEDHGPTIPAPRGPARLYAVPTD